MHSPYSIFPSVTTSGLSMIIATAWEVAVLGCTYYPCSQWWLQSNRATSSKTLPKVSIRSSVHSSILIFIHSTIHWSIHPSIGPSIYPTVYTAVLYLTNPCKARLPFFTPHSQPFIYQDDPSVVIHNMLSSFLRAMYSLSIHAIWISQSLHP